MGINAVLPSRTSWGFQFQPAAKDMSTCTVSAVPQTSFSTNLAAQHLSNLFVSKPAKRKRSIDSTDDEDLNDVDTNDLDSKDEPEFQHSFGSLSSRRSLSPSTPNNCHQNSNLRKPTPTTKINSHHISKSQTSNSKQSLHRSNSHHSLSIKTKRPRFERVVSRALPVSRLVETLDKKALETLITTLVQTRPDIAQQIIHIAPAVTVNTALEALREKLERIYHGLPYKGDQSGDYAYLRVKSAIEDFLTSLSDYTSHFLPPNEQQPSNSLAFLDAATTLLHRLPNWNSSANNHSKQVAYDRIAEAWIVALQEASRKANGLGLAYGGWQHKLDNHNEACHGLITPAVNFLRYQLKWVNQGQQSSSLPWESNIPTAIQSNSSLNSINHSGNDSNYNNNNNNSHLFGRSSFPVSLSSWK